MKLWRITEIGELEYALVDDTGTVRRTHESPSRLSEWAFDNGADEVRHEYDNVKHYYGTR